MKLLEAEPQLAPSAPGEPPRQTLPTPPSEVSEARSCKACGATMAPDQDWCLSCGAAAAGPARRRPGWRAAASVIGLTLVLVIGAVAASYAALTDDPAATPPQAVAQAPSTEPAATSSTPAETPSAEAPTATEPAGGTQPSDLPTVPTPGETPAVTPSPTPVTPTPTPGDVGGEVPTSPAAPADPTPNQPVLAPLALADGAVTVYDPYGRATATGDPGRAVDDNAATSWYVDPKDPALIGVGLAVDLGELRAVKAIELETGTPGFRLELYGTDEAGLPPDILDTRWTHIRDVEDAGVVDPGKAGDVEGRERIVLGAGATKYRNLVLWFTGPPTERPRLRITELKLYR